jgi:hypothetical protein
MRLENKYIIRVKINTRILDTACINNTQKLYSVLKWQSDLGTCTYEGSS